MRTRKAEMLKMLSHIAMAEHLLHVAKKDATVVVTMLQRIEEGKLPDDARIAQRLTAFAEEAQDGVNRAYEILSEIENGS